MYLVVDVCRGFVTTELVSLHYMPGRKNLDVDRQKERFNVNTHCKPLHNNNSTDHSTHAARHPDVQHTAPTDDRQRPPAASRDTKRKF